MMGTPVVIVTVTFDKGPLTGEQITILMGRVAERFPGAAFEGERGYYDGPLLGVGLRSGLPKNNTRLVPAIDGLPFFRPDTPYGEVKVIAYTWGRAMNAVLTSWDAYREAVQSCAALIAEEYGKAMAGGTFV